MQEPLGDMASVPWSPWCPGSGRSPGEGNANPLQYSYLENSMDRGAWQAIVHGVTKSQIRLNTHTHTHIHTLLRKLATYVSVQAKLIHENQNISNMKIISCLFITQKRPLLFFNCNLNLKYLPWSFTLKKSYGLSIICPYFQPCPISLLFLLL